jgi:hypothetical protein
MARGECKKSTRALRNDVYLAKATVATILSTLSNNDFVAVFNFSDTADQVVGCFQDKLVQATPENIKKFNIEMETMKPEGVANLTVAFLSAFTILQNYRNESRCGADMSCNQLIMLITDGIASNITEVSYQPLLSTCASKDASGSCTRDTSNASLLSFVKTLPASTPRRRSRASINNKI